MTKNVEDLNTEDIRYVDEKVDNFKTEMNKALNKQGQQTAKIEGQVKMLENQLNTNTKRIEDKVDNIQDDITNNFNQLTTSITRLEVTQNTLSEAVQGINETLNYYKEIKNDVIRHDSRISALENNTKDEKETKREKLKSWTAIIVATISGVLALVGTILSICLK